MMFSFLDGVAPGGKARGSEADLGGGGRVRLFIGKGGNAALSSQVTPGAVARLSVAVCPRRYSW